jgi:hypothetical protein
MKVLQTPDSHEKETSTPQPSSTSSTVLSLGIASVRPDRARRTSKPVSANDGAAWPAKYSRGSHSSAQPRRSAVPSTWSMKPDRPRTKMRTRLLARQHLFGVELLRWLAVVEAEADARAKRAFYDLVSKGSAAFGWRSKRPASAIPANWRLKLEARTESGELPNPPWRT